MKHLLLAGLLLVGLAAHGQASAPVYRHCILIAAPAKTVGRYVTTLLTGADPATTGQVQEAEQVAKFTTEADALDYLSSHGWEVFSTTALTTTYGFAGTRYYLRRKQP